MKYLLSKSLIRISIKIFLIVFMFLPIGIPGIEYIKTYMVLTVLMYLFFFNFLKIKRLLQFELIWMVLMIYIALTFVYCEDYIIGFKAIIGEIILVAFYFLYRFYLIEIGVESYNRILFNLGKWFYVVSFIFYLLSIYFYFFENVDYMPFLYEGQSGRVLGAIFNTWSDLPRLTGLKESIDSFNWMSTIFIVVFWMNKMYKWLIVGIVCSLLTFSITFIIFLACTLLYFIIKKRKLLATTFIIIPILGLLYYFYKTNSWFNYVVESRLNAASSGTGRFDIWYFLFEKIKNRPVFGYGINQTKVYLKDYPDSSIMSAHNTLIEILFYSGIIGVIIYLLFILSFFIACHNLDIKNKSIYFRLIFLSYFIYSMANTSIYDFSTLFFFSFIFIYSHSLKNKEITIYS